MTRDGVGVALEGVCIVSGIGVLCLAIWALTKLGAHLDQLIGVIDRAIYRKR